MLGLAMARGIRHVHGRLLQKLRVSQAKQRMKASVVKEALLQGGLDQQELSAFMEDDLSKLWRAGFVNTTVLKKATAFELERTLPGRYALHKVLLDAFSDRVSVPRPYPMCGRRAFGVGLAVVPESNYYVEPEIYGLWSDLEAGKYCALLGPRQSGKTSAAMAVIRQMMDYGHVHPVLLGGLAEAIPSWSTSTMFKTLIRFMRLASPQYFGSATGSDAAAFSSLFHRNTLPVQVCLMVDEADSLLSMPDHCLDVFFATIRDLKQRKDLYNLKSCMLIGVETVRDLLEGRYRRRCLIEGLGQSEAAAAVEEPRRLSPFPHDYYIRTSGFHLDDIVALLEQANEDCGGAVKDVKEIAASVLELTSGHKGLVGTCLAFMLRMELFTIKAWLQQVRSYELATYVFGQATYSRIVDSFRKQARSKEGYERLMEFVQAVEKPCELETVRDLLAEGVLVVKRKDPVTGDCYVGISSPLLLTAMLKQCVITSEKVEDPPVKTVVDRKWVIMQVVQTMEGFTTKDSQAEYALQFAFMCRLKAVLLHAYPMHGLLVLPEVKEKIDARSEKRLDTLVKEGTKFGFEFFVKGRAERLAECMQRAKRYHDQHGAQVFVVDFSMDIPAVQTRPDHDGVIYVGVTYQRAKVVAIFVDCNNVKDKYEGTRNGTVELSERESLARLLKSCGITKDLSEGKRVHACIQGSEHHNDVYLANLAIQMYGKCGDLEAARRVFENLSQTNSFSWSIMITAYTQNGHMQEARTVFERMPARDVVTWNSTICMYAQNGHMENAKGMFDGMPQRDVISWNSMVAAYAQKGYLEDAKRAFDRMPEWDVVSCTSMFNGYAQDGHLEKAKGMFDEMPSRNVVSWTAMVQAFADNGHPQESKSTFDMMPERNVVSWTAVVVSYAQSGDPREARSMFDKMPKRNVVSWTGMLQAYAQEGCLVEAKSLFDAMPERNVVSWNVMFAAYAQNGDVEEAKNLFDRMAEHSEVSWHLMILAYAQNGHLEEAKSTFLTVPEKHVISCNAMVSAYAQSGDVDGAKCMFDMIPVKDVFSWTAMLSAYAQNGQLQEAKNLFCKIPEPNVVSRNVMLAMYAQSGHLQAARSSFDSMLEKNIVSWNAMLAAYAQSGHGKDALDFFHAMLLEAVQPTEVSFVSILVACSRIGMVDRGRCYFTSMTSDYSIQPSREHFCCMIDLLGRAGRLSDAEELIGSMPLSPDDVAWGTLLSACRTYHDTERGRRASKHVVDLDPQNAGAYYVLLSNTYAAVGKQEQASMLRKAMGDGNVRKRAGLSMIEQQQQQQQQQRQYHVENVGGGGNG